jgi:hypothetical protein
LYDRHGIPTNVTHKAVNGKSPCWIHFRELTKGFKRSGSTKVFNLLCLLCLKDNKEKNVDCTLWHKNLFTKTNSSNAFKHLKGHAKKYPDIKKMVDAYYNKKSLQPSSSASASITVSGSSLDSSNGFFRRQNAVQTRLSISRW